MGSKANWTRSVAPPKNKKRFREQRIYKQVTPTELAHPGEPNGRMSRGFHWAALGASDMLEVLHLNDVLPIGASFTNSSGRTSRLRLSCLAMITDCAIMGLSHSVAERVKRWG
jgi:hypothetical protein